MLKIHWGLCLTPAPGTGVTEAAPKNTRGFTGSRAGRDAYLSLGAFAFGSLGLPVFGSRHGEQGAPGKMPL